MTIPTSGIELGSKAWEPRPLSIRHNTHGELLLRLSIKHFSISLARCIRSAPNEPALSVKTDNQLSTEEEQFHFYTS